MREEIEGCHPISCLGIDGGNQTAKLCYGVVTKRHEMGHSSPGVHM